MTKEDIYSSTLLNCLNFLFFFRITWHITIFIVRSRCNESRNFLPFKRFKCSSQLSLKFSPKLLLARSKQFLTTQYLVHACDVLILCSSETSENLHLIHCTWSEKKILFLITVFTIRLYSDPLKSLPQTPALYPKFCSHLLVDLQFPTRFSISGLQKQILCVFLAFTLRARNATQLINIGLTCLTNTPKY
jgi:hypothetical protein